MLADSELGDRSEALRFRAATSLLYGALTDLRRLALEAPDPLDVPHLAAALDRFESVVQWATSG